MRSEYAQEFIGFNGCIPADNDQVRQVISVRQTLASPVFGGNLAAEIEFLKILTGGCDLVGVSVKAVDQETF